jgi:hypothetical protein
MNDGSYREVKREQDHRPQNGAWAPGNYFCKCVPCGNTFLGDKRAHECAPCAYKDGQQAGESNSFTMPILGTRTRVVWTPTAEDRARAKDNHSGQSLEHLADRMGVSWCELEAILANEPYGLIARDETNAVKRVHLILRQRRSNIGGHNGI